MSAFGTAGDELITLLALVTIARINEAIARALHAGHCHLLVASLGFIIVTNALDDFVGLPAEVGAALRAKTRARILGRNVIITLVTIRYGIALGAVRIALMAASLARELWITFLHIVEPEGRTALEA